MLLGGEDVCLLSGFVSGTGQAEWDVDEAVG